MRRPYLFIVFPAPCFKARSSVWWRRSEVVCGCVCGSSRLAQEENSQQVKTPNKFLKTSSALFEWVPTYPTYPDFLRNY
jgi:hypothetical protein